MDRKNDVKIVVYGTIFFSYILIRQRYVKYYNVALFNPKSIESARLFFKFVIKTLTHLKLFVYFLYDLYIFYILLY